MAKALGVGGIFFTSPDPQALMAWYEKALGLPAEGGAYATFTPASMPAEAVTCFSPFQQDTDYFAPSTRGFMLNLVVDDLAGALAQVQAAGARLAGEPQSYSYGHFGWFVDPDGNKVELWQPLAAAE
ncbi:VOC family protein [Massilia sp. TS11]|uniref:VOC family protein n=1 Tax=Massilia sp. TS11 TaxID=2908003 RepID=UPI001EDC65F5|nr:VOC family protein [Massilia sp. TS11]MCG2586334.1 VOC family protein [Massilia sp. TS11]